MSKKAIIISIIILIVGVITFTLLTKQKPIIEKPDETIDAGISNTIIIKDRITKLGSKSKTINAIIPEFQNLEDGYENYLNLKIYNELNDGNVYDTVTEGFASDEVENFTYEVSYERYNCNDYVSIVAEQYISFKGIARPRIQKKCYVINAKENFSPSLADIFEDKLNYKKNIVKEINNQAEELKIELVGGNGLTTIDDTQQFYIKDNKLIIYYEASEIAATAVGELEFEMPFEMVNNKFVI